MNCLYPAIDNNLRLFARHNDSHVLQAFRSIWCASCRVSIIFQKPTIKWAKVLLEQAAIYCKCPPPSLRWRESSWQDERLRPKDKRCWHSMMDLSVLLSIEPTGYKMFNCLQMILFHQICVNLIFLVSWNHFSWSIVRM